ncbi:MAG: hypothetical protein ACR2O1_02115 [Boseongicola sp.]
MRVYLAASAFVMSVGAANSQDAPLPAEQPPEGYAARAYIDSQGCAFSRAELNGAVSWVARLDTARQPICDETPTIAPAQDIVVETKPVAVSVSPTPVRVTTSQMAPRTTVVPKGYRKVWDDDRLNTHRGPRTAQGDAAMARIWSNKVPMTWIGN